MHGILRILLVVALLTTALAQSPEPPISDSRLPVSTLVREDIFAGFMRDDIDRFTRAERNLHLLLEQRPQLKPEVLAWQAGAAYYRAVRAYESKNKEEFEKKYKASQDLFAEAAQLGPGEFAVSAILGGTNSLFADRLPGEYREPAWSQAYDSYKVLWELQGSAIEELPVHMRGELLAGIAQSAQRTGRKEEAAEYLDKILALLKDTPYEAVAKQWKANPAAADNTSLTCRSCHDAGRLSARLNALK